MARGNRGVLVVAGAALTAAVVTELRKTPEDRTWRGSVLGVVPYDLRVPTVSRLKATFWDPANPKIIVPHAFGVGWSVNLASLVGRLGRRAG